MYELDYSYCTYNFTPGWFNDIVVNDLKVYWNAEKVTSSTAEETNSDNYLVWSGRLAKGAKLKTKVEYPKSAFKTLNANQQASDVEVKNYTSGKSTGNTTNSSFFVLIVVVVIVNVLATFMGTGYNRHSGYGYGYGRPYYHHHHHSSCASRSSCVSSCACACACAGGGRAGCSKKDFYGTNLRTNNIKKVLKK